VIATNTRSGPARVWPSSSGSRKRTPNSGIAAPACACPRSGLAVPPRMDPRAECRMPRLACMWKPGQNCSARRGPLIHSNCGDVISSSAGHHRTARRDAYAFNVNSERSIFVDAASCSRLRGRRSSAGAYSSVSRKGWRRAGGVDFTRRRRDCAYKPSGQAPPPRGAK